MRYGLMSNYRRSWSKIGERSLIDNQQEFANRYCYSALDPTTGDNFHIIGWNDVSTRHTYTFLEKLQEAYPHTHNIIVWDGAPFHKPKVLQTIDDMTIIFLPSYSPELNPVERLFGELRKITANKIFASIEEQTLLLQDALEVWMNNEEKMKQLTGYDWILKQWDCCV